MYFMQILHKFYWPHSMQFHDTQSWQKRWRINMTPSAAWVSPKVLLFGGPVKAIVLLAALQRGRLAVSPQVAKLSNPWWKFSHFDMVLAPRNKQVETCQIRRQTAMIVVHEPIFFEVDSTSHARAAAIVWYWCCCPSMAAAEEEEAYSIQSGWALSCFSATSM